MLRTSVGDVDKERKFWGNYLYTGGFFPTVTGVVDGPASYQLIDSVHFIRVFLCGYSRSSLFSCRYSG